VMLDRHREHQRPARREHRPPASDPARAQSATACGPRTAGRAATHGMSARQGAIRGTAQALSGLSARSTLFLVAGPRCDTGHGSQRQ
jgi:hypothetical protein